MEGKRDESGQSNEIRKEGDEKRERKLKEESKKVSRRVPTAVTLFFVNDVYSETKKEHGKPKLGNN